MKTNVQHDAVEALETGEERERTFVQALRFMQKRERSVAFLWNVTCGSSRFSLASRNSTSRNDRDEAAATNQDLMLTNSLKQGASRASFRRFWHNGMNPATCSTMEWRQSQHLAPIWKATSSRLGKQCGLGGKAGELV